MAPSWIIGRNVCGRSISQNTYSKWNGIVHEVCTACTPLSICELWLNSLHVSICTAPIYRHFRSFFNFNSLWAQFLLIIFSSHSHVDQTTASHIRIEYGSGCHFVGIVIKESIFNLANFGFSKLISNRNPLAEFHVMNPLTYFLCSLIFIPPVFMQSLVQPIWMKRIRISS